MKSLSKGQLAIYSNMSQLISRFLSKSNKQTEVKLLKQFDTWKSDSRFFTVKSRMPWLGEKKGLLTTSEDAENSWWGTIISDNLFYNPAPWIDPQMRQPGIIWYWINEDDCGLDRKPGNVQFGNILLAFWGCDPSILASYKFPSRPSNKFIITGS